MEDMLGGNGASNSQEAARLDEWMPLDIRFMDGSPEIEVFENSLVSASITMLLL
jgi:hypothetical protein